jgi:hypothetical protein
MSALSGRGGVKWNIVANLLNLGHKHVYSIEFGLEISPLT